jgi:ABC-2 type transport system permease protein
VRNIPTAVVDQSQSSLSRELVGELAATQTFRPIRAPKSEAEAIGLLAASEVGAVIVIPPDLDRRLYRGRGAEISILADATNPTVAAAVAAAGEARPRGISLRTHSRATKTLCKAPLRIAVLPFYNPERRTAVFIVPGLIGVILTMTMMLMTALAIVRERERGTFEFLIATPIGRGEVMIGKILPYLVVGHVQVALVLALGWAIFDVPIRGSLADLGLGALPFLAAMLALGLVVSSLARTQFQAAQLSFFFFLPSMLLSGFMFPFEAMPVPAQWIGAVLPLTHFLRIARGVLLKGAPLEALGWELAAIAGFAVAGLGLAIAMFRKQLG